jgi:lipoprotein-releasing system ATP-binding protein
MMIQATNLIKRYGTLEVLKEVSLTVNEGEIVAIVGPSGAGKTTLLQLLGTLDEPSNKAAATISINNTDILKINSKDLAKFRNQYIGFIFQFHQLLPEFTALENVCIPAFIANKSKEQAEEKATELLNFLGLKDRIHHKPNELSGGEQQRVAVARALINNPKVIFADEPSGNLDSDAAAHLHQLFFKLRDKFGQTFVIVTHNQDLAQMADRKIEMIDGKIITN